MRAIILESAELQLRLTERHELETVLVMEQDPRNAHYVYHWSVEEHMAKMVDNNWLHAVFIEKVSQRIVGYILMEGLNNHHGSIELTRIVIGEKNKGYGRKALRMIKQMCFEKNHFHRLWLDVFTDNLVAVRLYKSEGYFLEGTVRECKKYREQYSSMHIMSMLEMEYLETNTKETFNQDI